MLYKKQAERFGESRKMRLAAAASFILILVFSVKLGSGQTSPKYSREDFPSDFVFGAGTSAYQVS